MYDFGKEFLEHFDIINETRREITFKCKDTNKQFVVYKNTLPKRYIICKCCGKKIKLYDNKDYYTKKYKKAVDDYFSETDITEKKLIQKRIYYYRKNAGVPTSDLEIRACREQIKELNNRILMNEAIRRTINYNSEEYAEYKKEADKVRILFKKIKRVIPDFTEYDEYPDYKEYILSKL